MPLSDKRLYIAEGFLEKILKMIYDTLIRFQL